MKALLVNFSGLEKWLLDSGKRGVAYRVTVGKQRVHNDDVSGLFLPWSEQEVFSITPVLMGSGRGFGQVMLGVGLVALAIVAGPAAGGFMGLGAGLGGMGGVAAGGAAMGLIGGAAATAIGAIGASLILGGVSQLLSPQPQNPSLSGAGRLRPGENTNASGPQGVSRATSGEQSYAFQGPANTVGVGNTVPLIYGEVLTGSQLLSSNVEITDESDKTSEYFERPGPESVTVNGEKVTFKFASLSGLRTRRWSDENRALVHNNTDCLLYTSPSPRDGLLSRMPSSA